MTQRGEGEGGGRGDEEGLVKRSARDAGRKIGITPDTNLGI